MVFDLSPLSLSEPFCYLDAATYKYPTDVLTTETVCPQIIESFFAF